MCWSWTDDPGRDAERWDEELTRRKKRHYVGECIHCNEAVYESEEYYDIEGDILHEDCLFSWAEQYKR